MSRLDLERQQQDIHLRRSFDLPNDTTVLLPCEKGFRLDLGTLTYEQAHHVLAAAAHAGVNLKRRRTR